VIFSHNDCLMVDGVQTKRVLPEEFLRQQGNVGEKNRH